MEARNRQLPEWLMRIKSGQLELPRFQRMEAWGYREVTDLLNAVLNGLPIGSVLVLEIGNEKPFVSRPLSGTSGGHERTNELLLDGQQRLTALWRSLTADYDDRTYFVDMESKDIREMEVVSVARWVRNGIRYPVWADTPKSCRERNLVPVELLRPDDAAEAVAEEWIEQAVEGDLQVDKALSKLVTKMRQQFATFTVPFLFLTVDTPRDVALDVFIKMNTRTVRLTTFDIIVAQTEETTGESLHDLVESLSATVPGLASYDAPEEIVLDVMALFQDRVPSNSGYLGLDFGRMVDDWPRMVSAAKEAVNFLEEEMLFDAARIPSETVVAPLVALFALGEEDPDALGNARILLRKYIWRAFLTERYERSVATFSLQDFRALRDLMEGRGDEQNIPIFDATQYPLPTSEAILQAGWPKRRDRLARGILQVSFRGGANDIADGIPISRRQLRRREYHHLYPVALLRNADRPQADADRALNCALISWKTNRVIAAKNPLQYLTERAEASSLGEAEIRSRLATHCIPYEEMASGAYDKFLMARSELVADAISHLCDGEDWRP